MRRVAGAIAGLLLPSLFPAGPLDGASVTHAPSSPRQELSLNGPWTLEVADLSLQVSVPANIPFVFGLSTWTKTFTLSLASPPAIAYLEFQGIVNSGTVTLNGAMLGPIYGFTQTRFDVSGVLNPAGADTLVVTLDDRLTPDAVPGGPIAGFVEVDGPIAYTFPIAWANRPGIVRGVSLVYSPLPVITDVYVPQTFDAALQNLTLSVLAVTGGELSLDASLQVSVSLTGAAVGSCKAVVDGKGQLGCQIQIASPSLWSTSNPILHNISVTLRGAGGTLDAGTDQIVFRKFDTQMPFLATEWTGSEGSNRGPIGTAGVESFPSDNDRPDGNYSETKEAAQMSAAFNAFLPYLCTDADPSQCVAGVVCFNWQDIEWPGMGYFYQGHFDYDRNGLVYEDRTAKSWPTAIFALLMSELP